MQWNKLVISLKSRIVTQLIWESLRTPSPLTCPIRSYGYTSSIRISLVCHKHSQWSLMLLNSGIFSCKTVLSYKSPLQHCFSCIRFAQAIITNYGQCSFKCRRMKINYSKKPILRHGIYHASFPL